MKSRLCRVTPNIDIKRNFTRVCQKRNLYRFLQHGGQSNQVMQPKYLVGSENRLDSLQMQY